MMREDEEKRMRGAKLKEDEEQRTDKAKMEEDEEQRRKRAKLMEDEEERVTQRGLNGREAVKKLLARTADDRGAVQVERGMKRINEDATEGAAEEGGGASIGGFWHLSRD